MNKGAATIRILMRALGGTASLLAGIAMVFASSTNLSVKDVSDREIQDNTAVVQRVSTVEAHYSDIDSRLTRIEAKIDKLTQ